MPIALVQLGHILSPSYAHIRSIQGAEHVLPVSVVSSKCLLLCVRSTLAAKRVLIEYRLDKPAFDWVLGEVTENASPHIHYLPYLSYLTTVTT